MKKPQLLIFITLSFLTLGLLTAPAAAIVVPPGTWIIQTTQDFNLQYQSGSGFTAQDTAQNIDVTFNVASGSLTGTGNLNVTSGGGLFVFTPNVTGTLQITANTPNFYCTINNQPLTNPVTYTANTTYTILWNNQKQIPTPIIIGTYHSVLYFRSDTYTTNKQTGYGLDTTATNQQQTITAAVTPGQTATYGFRVWKVTQQGTQTELTSGTPTAEISRNTNGAGWQNSTWLAPQTTLNMGFDALKVESYLSLDNGATWTLLELYVTNPIMSPLLLHQTWTFNLYTTYNTASSQTSYIFGSATYQSNINNVGLQPPTQTQLQTWNFLKGDYIMFILSTYTYLIGPAAYLLILMIPTVTLYLRHRNFGPVLILFALFGGPGGIVWIFIPAWASAAVDILLVLGASFLIWRLIR